MKTAETEFSLDLPELLYFGKGSCITTVSHLHAFYQLEICSAGELHGLSGNTEFFLRPGEYRLIPPETPHRFFSHGGLVEYYTLKFKFDSAVPGTGLVDDVVKYHISAILKILDSTEELNPFSVSGKEIVESHLRDLLYHLTRGAGSAPLRSEFLMSLRELICVYGYGINVNELADHCRCTRSQLKYRFKKEAHWNGSVKNFIDHVNLENAKKHLKYSDMTLTEIAKLMHFANIYVFSRFFKCRTGLPPREYRAGFEPKKQK